MKFNITVDVDWLDEEHNIDKVVQEGIAEKVSSAISEDAVKKIIDRAEKMLEDRVQKHVDESFKNLMAEPVTLTDSWGNKIGQFGDTASLIKDRFDKWAVEKVDKDGKVNAYGGDNRYTRLQWLVDLQVQKHGETFTKQAIDQVTKVIKEQLSNDLKVALGDRLITVMELDKLINTKQLK